MFCINCNLSIATRFKRHKAEAMSSPMMNILQAWISPFQISPSALVCDQCFNIIRRISESEDSKVPERVYGHNNVCLGCGISLLKMKRFKRVPIGSAERNVILDWVESKLDCNTFKQEMADQHIEMPQSTPTQFAVETVVAQDPLAETLPAQPSLIPPVVTDQNAIRIQPNTTITIPGYKRAAATSRRCLFPDCNGRDRLLVPREIRERLLIDSSLYIPNCSRTCRLHMYSSDWSVLSKSPHRTDFTSAHIKNMLDLVRKCASRPLNFHNIREMSPHLCNYWLGMSPERFYEMLKEIPSLQKMVNPELSLAAYLIKLRTNESTRRLSLLLNIPRSTLERYMNTAKECLAIDNYTIVMTPNLTCQLKPKMADC